MATSAVIRKNEKDFSRVLAVRIQSIQYSLPDSYLSGFVSNPKTLCTGFVT